MNKRRKRATLKFYTILQTLHKNKKSFYVRVVDAPQIEWSSRTWRISYIYDPETVRGTISEAYLYQKESFYQLFAGENDCIPFYTDTNKVYYCEIGKSHKELVIIPDDLNLFWKLSATLNYNGYAHTISVDDEGNTIMRINGCLIFSDINGIVTYHGKICNSLDYILKNINVDLSRFAFI